MFVVGQCLDPDAEPQTIVDLVFLRKVGLPHARTQLGREPQPQIRCVTRSKPIHLITLEDSAETAFASIMGNLDRGDEVAVEIAPQRGQALALTEIVGLRDGLKVIFVITLPRAFLPTPARPDGWPHTKR